MRTLNKKSVAITAAALMVAGSGAALAYWTQSGSGTGSASAGSTVAISVNQTSTVSNLYPGGAAQDLSGDFTNTNDSAVYVAGVSVADVTTDKAGCTAADFEIGGAAVVGAEVAKGTHVGSWSGLTIAMKDLSSNQDACKGAAVTVHYASN